jgi:Flp pilus assembly pilin Flp
LGASLIEYALLVGLIAMVCLLAVTFFGGNVSHSMSTSASSVAGT